MVVALQHYILLFMVNSTDIKLTRSLQLDQATSRIRKVCTRLAMLLSQVLTVKRIKQVFADLAVDWLFFDALRLLPGLLRRHWG